MATRAKTTRAAEPKSRRPARPADRAGEARAPLPAAGAGPGRKAKADGRGGADPAYLALIHRFPLRPLRSDAELNAAAAIIDELTDRDGLSAAEADYLDVLGDLVERYEDEHVAMPRVSDAAMLRSLMDEKGVRQADVARGTGISKTVLSLVLNGKRDLTRGHIAALSKYFGVDAAAFLDPA